MLMINFDWISTLDASTYLYWMTNFNIILILNVYIELHQMILNNKVLDQFEVKMCESARTHIFNIFFHILRNIELR